MIAKRADLASRCKKTKMCKFFLENACERGDRCGYAHSENEIVVLPDLRYTQLCPMAVDGKECTDPKCRYAHHQNELKKFPGSGSDKAAPTGEPATVGLQRAAESHPCALNLSASNDESTLDCDSDSIASESCEQEFECVFDFGKAYSREVARYLGKDVSYNQEVNSDSAGYRDDQACDDATVVSVSPGLSLAKLPSTESIGNVCNVPGLVQQQQEQQSQSSSSEGPLPAGQVCK